MPVALVWRCHWLHARRPGLGIGKKQPRPPQTKIITHHVPCYGLWPIFLTQIVVSTNCKHTHCFVVITRSLIHFLVVQVFRLLDRLGSALRLHGSVHADLANSLYERSNSRARLSLEIESNASTAQHSPSFVSAAQLCSR
jgi:hypothetical protein